MVSGFETLLSWWCGGTKSSLRNDKFKSLNFAERGAGVEKRQIPLECRFGTRQSLIVQNFALFPQRLALNRVAGAGELVPCLEAVTLALDQSSIRSTHSSSQPPVTPDLRELVLMSSGMWYTDMHAGKTFMHF